MKRHLHFAVLLTSLLLAAGCVAPAPIQPQSGEVVQGSTAAPTEILVVEPSTVEPSTVKPTIIETPTLISIVDTPTAIPPTPITPTGTPALVLTSTPLPTVSKTPIAATASPTADPTAQPTAGPTVQPTLSPTRTPYPTGVFVASHRGFSTGTGYTVVGEVLNTDQVPVFGAKVIANFYDSDDKLVGAQQTQASFAMTEPEVGNPFRLEIENLTSAVARYELTVTWEDVSLIEFRHLTVVDGEVGQGEVIGQMRNDQESTLTSIVVAVTFYDAGGNVVNTADTFLGGQTIAPNQSLPFAIPISGDTPVYDHYWIEAQGNLNLF